MQTLRLIATEKKIRLLELMLYAPGKAGVRALAKKAGVNPGYASTLIRRLERGGLAEKGAIRPDDPRVRGLKLLLNIDRLAAAWRRLRKAGALGFGVFGSWAKGANSEGSDLDVWVRLGKEPGSEDSAKIRAILREETGASEVSLIALTPQRLAEVRRADSLFYSTLLNSFHIGGERID